MSVDFTKPVATGDRAQNLVDTKDTLVAVAKQRPDLAAGGITADMIRWSSSGNKWEIFNGSAWVDLASTFAINVSSFNGQAASYYTNIAARLGYTPVNKAGDTMTGPLVLNADPSATLGAATKGYVDTGLAAKASSSHAHSWDQITNKGLAEGGASLDANTALYHNFISQTNTPNGNYWHIIQTFYNSIGTTQPRMQIAIPYAAGVATIYTRYYYGGWSSWQSPEDQWTYYKSFGSNGYARMAGGLIIQWGTFTRTSSTHSVSFPISFPAACFSVVQNDNYSAQINDSSRAYSITASGFTSGRADPSSFNVNYIALGY